LRDRVPKGIAFRIRQGIAEVFADIAQRLLILAGAL